jgi:hypothetical protein
MFARENYEILRWTVLYELLEFFILMNILKDDRVTTSQESQCYVTVRDGRRKIPAKMKGLLLTNATGTNLI